MNFSVFGRSHEDSRWVGVDRHLATSVSTWAAHFQPLQLLAVPFDLAPPPIEEILIGIVWYFCNFCSHFRLVGFKRWLPCPSWLFSAGYMGVWVPSKGALAFFLHKDFSLLPSIEPLESWVYSDPKNCTSVPAGVFQLFFSHPSFTPHFRLAESHTDGTLQGSRGYWGWSRHVLFYPFPMLFS